MRNRVITVIVSAVAFGVIDAVAAQVCPPTPDACRTAGESSLKVVDRPPQDDGQNGGDKLTWRWMKGEETSYSDFSGPIGSTDYALCIYAGSTPTLVSQQVVPHGLRHPPQDMTGWVFPGGIFLKRYAYIDSSPDASVRRIDLRPGDDGRTRIAWFAKGRTVDIPTTPLELPVTVQLHKSDDILCWGATYATSVKNRPGAFSAKSN